MRCTCAADSKWIGVLLDLSLGFFEGSSQQQHTKVVLRVFRKSRVFHGKCMFGAGVDIIPKQTEGMGSSETEFTEG